MFIELTAAGPAVCNKFSLNKNYITYFSRYPFSEPPSNYKDCKSIVEVLGGTEGTQLYHVKETYEELKEILSA